MSKAILSDAAAAKSAASAVFTGDYSQAHGVFQHSDLAGCSLGGLRELLRKHYPASRGEFSAYANTAEAVAVLAGTLSVNQALIFCQQRRAAGAGAGAGAGLVPVTVAGLVGQQATEAAAERHIVTAGEISTADDDAEAQAILAEAKAKAESIRKAKADAKAKALNARQVQAVGTVKFGGDDLPDVGGTQYVPDLDPHYDAAGWRGVAKAGALRFTTDAHQLFKLLAAGKTVWLAGKPGCGKTTVIEHFCALTRWPLVKIHGHKDLTADSFVGCKGAKAGSTVWVDGPLVIALQIGAVLLVDEAGRCPADTTNILHGVLEKNATSKLTLVDDGGRVITPHPNFRIVACDNSLGFGDDSGLHPDVRVQDAAYLSRFTAKVWVDYPLASTEQNILVRKTGIDKGLAKTLVSVAADTRKAQDQQQLLYSLSTRHLLAWAECWQLIGAGPAFALTVLNAVPPCDQAVITEIAQRHLGDKLAGATLADEQDATEGNDNAKAPF